MPDIVSDVADENEDGERRDTSVPIWDDRFKWWTDAIRREIKERDIDQKDLKTAGKFGESKVSRAISRKKPLHEVLLALSLELGVPPPVLLPESEEEALHLVKQQRLFRLDQMANDVTKPPTNGSKRKPR